MRVARRTRWGVGLLVGLAAGGANWLLLAGTVPLTATLVVLYAVGVAEAARRRRCGGGASGVGPTGAPSAPRRTHKTYRRTRRPLAR